MSEDNDSSTPTPNTRAGTGADLARRMDRMEQRQDSMEGAISNLSATVSRVEQNQAHAEELNKLRFESLNRSVDQNTGKLDQFIARIEGIIDGTIETTQTKQGAAVLEAYLAWQKEVNARLPLPNETAEYREWRKDLEQRIDLIEAASLNHSARVAGRTDILSWSKIIFVTVAPIITTLVALATFFSK